MVAKSVGQEELASVEDNWMEFDGFNQSRDITATASSNTSSTETYR